MIWVKQIVGLWLLLSPFALGSMENDPNVTTNTNSIDVGVEQTKNGGAEDGGNQTTSTAVEAPKPTVVSVPICLRGDATESGQAFGCPTGEQLACGGDGHVFTVYVTQPGATTSTSSEVCIKPGDPLPDTQPPVDIPGEVLAAFKKVPLPESTIEVEPPGGRTLVNFRTLLFTPAVRHQIPVKLEAVKVNLILEVSPDHFLRHHGDDTTQETTIAGKKWSTGVDVSGPEFVSHIYTDTFDAVPVSVDTTWSAKFKVVGEKDWRPVNGTVTKVGEPINLEVLEATPQLVENPY